MPTVSSDLCKDLLSTPSGLRWLMGLETMAERHGLSEIGVPFQQGRKGAVYPCLASSGPAVLKIGAADEIELEAAALSCWRGSGLALEVLSSELPAVEPLEPHLAVLVLERAQPGTTLPDAPPEQARALLAELLEKLYSTRLRFALESERDALSVNGVRDLSDSVEHGIESLGPEHEMSNGVRLVDLRPVGALAKSLVESSDPGRWRLLHGDLHGHNLLVDRGRLKVIDPLPQWGEPEIDLARALVGPPLLHLPDNLWEGAQLLAEAVSVDAARVYDWARVFGALRVAGEGPDSPLDPQRRWRLLNIAHTA